MPETLWSVKVDKNGDKCVATCKCGGKVIISLKRFRGSKTFKCPDCGQFLEAEYMGTHAKD